MRQIFLGGAAAIGLVAGGMALAPQAESQVPFRSAANAMEVDSRGVMTLAPLLERTTPAVVDIATEGTRTTRRGGGSDDMEELFRRFMGDDFDMDEFEERGSRPTASVGSGVIMDARRGLVVTNAHVVDGADRITVRLKDRRTLDAELVGTDEQTDIAILRLEEASGLVALEFADSDALKVGDMVVAVGNPFGIGQSVSSGIVSALSRESSRSTDTYQDYIQTDAAINQGNSGGALMDSRGRLVGINTAILSRSGGSNGIGFAIPANMAKSVMRQLVDFGEVRRGRIGVVIRDVDPVFAEAYDLDVERGALVQSVGEDTPAAKAGLKAGDVVVSFDGEVITSSSDLRNTVGLFEAGKRADIAYIRDGKRRSARILVEAVEDDPRETMMEERVRPEPAAMKTETFEGATVTDMPRDVADRTDVEGVFVEDVERGSRAWRGGLQAGDLIRRIDNRNIESLDDFADALERRDGATAVEIERDGNPLYLAIR